MTLIARAAAASGLDAAHTERALGTVIAALKLSVPPAIMAPVERAVPELGPLAAASLPAMGGRTGELVTMVTELTSERGASQLARQLEAAGISPDARRRLIATLVQDLRARADGPAVDALLALVPAFAQLGA